MRLLLLLLLLLLSTKTECDYLNGWIKKQSHMQKSHPKVLNPSVAGEREKEKEIIITFISLGHPVSNTTFLHCERKSNIDTLWHQ